MKKLISAALWMFAAVLAIFELIALIDPLGTKLADDGDPFGPPAPWYQHAAFIIVIVASACIAYQIPKSKGKRNESIKAHDLRERS